MYELEIFKAGFMIGYFICFVAILLGSLIGYMILHRRMEKYLIATKQMQKFEDWKKTTKKILMYK